VDNYSLFEKDRSVLVNFKKTGPSAGMNTVSIGLK